MIALYKYTIPKVVSETIQVLGRLWPKKNNPKYIDRDALLSWIKKMCSMGMLRRFVYTKEGNNIVIYSTTPEFCKVIYQALKLNTDAKHEKDILPPLESVEKAAALKGYLEQLNKEGNIVQIVCEDLEDFKTVSSILCTLILENMLPHVYYSSEGALKSAAYNLKESLVRVTSVKDAEKGERRWSLSVRSGHIRFF